MNAYDLVKKHGKNLVGRTIMTEQEGAWPGGKARVLELFPDKEGAPEIVMQVRGLERQGRHVDNEDDDIGVFDHEEVTLLPKERKK